MSQLAVTPGLVTHASAAATATGAIAASAVTGGTGSYTSYAWTNSAGASTVATPTTLAAKSSLLPGLYTLTVTDSASATASYVYDVSFTSALSTIVNASDPATSDYFGISSAVDGQYMIVGASNKTQTQTGAGAAYIYKRADMSATGTYAFETKLVSTISGTQFYFGGSVAISGDTVVVGENRGGTSTSGKVYVWFRTTGTTWTQQGPIVPSDPTASDAFGTSVAIDGDYIVVGASLWDRKTPSALANCGAAYVFVRTGTTWAQQAQLLANDLSAGDQSGQSVAISGTTVVVGAFVWSQKTPSVLLYCGAAYVFTRTNTTWTQQAQLLAPDPGANDQFGGSVTVSGDYIAVGAGYWASKAPAITDCGCVYVYFRSGTTWTQQAQLTGGDPVASALFGSSVSIYGSCLVAGAYGRSTNTGCAYIYKRTGTSWFLANRLTASDAAANDNFGYSVDVSDRYTVIGAQAWEGSFTDQGVVYTSTVPGTFPPTVTPGLVTHASGPTNADGAIAASAVTGGTGSYTSYAWTNSAGASTVATPTTLAAKSSLLPGLYTLTVTDSASATASYVYDVSYVSAIASTYIVNASDPAANDNFGYSSAVDGQYMIVGAYQKTQTQTGAGAAYIYKRTDMSATGTYAFETKLISQTTGLNFNFGYSVAISGDTVVVGEYGGGTSSSGKAYVWFRTGGTTWTQQGPIVPSDPSAIDYFGYSVAIDGDYIAVGAFTWDQKSPAISNCGAAYVFLRTNTTWAQQARLLASDPSASDFFGYSVSISGTTVVVGAYTWDRKAPSALTDCGCVYIYVRSGTTWTQQAQLLAADPSANDQFGYSVSVSGDYIAASANTWDSKTPAFTDCGCVYVFFRSGATWTQQAQLTGGDAANSANMGYSVSVNANATYLIAGAYNRTSGAGAAYLYKRTGTSWFLTKQLTASDAAATDFFGWSVDVSDRYIAIGAQLWEGAFTDQGAVYTSTLPGGATLAVTPGLVTHATGPTNADGAIAATAVAGGIGTVTYAWTSGIGATTITTPTTLVAKSALLPGQYTLTATDSDSNVGVYAYDVVYPSAIAAGYIVQASDPATSDNFGYSSAVDGQYMVVGAYNKTQTQTSAGAAYIYKRSDASATGTYAFEAKLVSGTTGTYFYFGRSVAISGDTVVIGEYGGGTSERGKVYIWFRSSGTTWTQQGPIVPSDPSAIDYFGISVAIDGDYIAVGAFTWNQKSPAISDCGAAYVFLRTNTTWAQQARLLASDPSASDSFGYSVSISGTTVVVGACAWDRKAPSALTDCGCVYIYVRSGTTWTQQAQLLAADPSANDQFGYSVSVSGDYIAASANTWDSKTPAFTDCGCVYVFFRSGATWTQQAQLTGGDAANSANMGYSVSVNANATYLIAGAYNRTSGAGAAYLYKRTGTSWFLTKQLTASDAAANDNFGYSVDVSDRYFTIGAQAWEGTFTDQGAVYTSTLPGGATLAVTPGLVTHASGPTNADGAIAATTVSGGIGTVTYAWTSGIGATTITTPTTLVAKSALLPGQYTLTATDSDSNVGVYTYDVVYPFAIAAGYIVNASDPTFNDYFGYSSAIDGQYMVVGAYNKNQTQTVAGAAYIYKRTDTSATGTYGFETKLISGTTGTNFKFGYSVAISGDTVVVGELQGGTSSSGKAYVWFRTSGTTWTQQGPLVPTDPTASDNFGCSVAIDGDYIVVGAWFWDQKTPSAILNCGAAYVFFRSGAVWAQQSQLLASVPTSGDIFGNSVAVSGATAVIGAYAWSRSTPSALTNCGAAYVFFRQGTTWTQQDQLLADDPTASDRFGGSVSLSGDYIAVGAHRWDSKAPAVTDCGCVYVFIRSGTTWTQQTKLIAGDPIVYDFLGWAVSINGSYLVATAYGRANSAGCAYLYKRTGTNWSLVRRLTASDAAASDLFGCSVDVSDRYVVLGAYQWEGAFTDQGAIYTTVLPETSLTVVAGAITRGNFGSTGTCAIGAPTVTGATGSVTYSWSTGQTTASLSAISPGTYVLTTTDSAGNYAITTYVVANWPQLVVTPGLIMHASGVTNATGAIALSAVTGGTGTYTTYAWTSGAGATTITTPTTLAAKSTLLPGQYTLTVTDTNSAVAVYVYDVSYVSPIASTYIVQASDPATSDKFGYSSAVDGQYMIAGAYYKTQPQSQAGAAYIYKRTDVSATGTYAFEKKLVSETPGSGYFFGGSVDISGDTVVIGEQGGGTTGSGKAYVWLRTSGTTWTQQAALVPSDPSSYDAFGSSVTIQGDYVAVGAPSWDRKTPSAINGCGAAYVFLRSGSTWAQQALLLAGDPSVGDAFGVSIGISASTVVVGANSWDQKTPSAIIDCGAAYVFTRTNTTWTQQAQLLASDSSPSDYFGYCVSVSGDAVTVGAYGWDSKTPSITDCGCVYVFVRSGTTWTQQARLTAGDGSAYDALGISVSMSSSYLVAGAYNRTSGAGAAYLYKRSGSSWLLVKQLTASDAATNDYFGYSVDVSDRYVAIGASQWEGAFTDQGAAYTTVLPEITLGVVAGFITRGNFGSTGTCAIATPTVTGATGSVTYSWSTGQTTASLTGISPGTFTLTTTDSAGNYAVTTYVVATWPQIVPSGLITHATGSTNATGAIGASTVTGGTGTYTTYAWTWSNGASTITTPTTLAAKSALLPGQYTLTITDSNGITGSYVYDVSYVSPIAAGYIVQASDPATSDNFGCSSAIDGQYMVVGAYNKTQTQTSAGAAYIYKRSDASATGTYAFEAKLVSGTTGTYFYFGWSVAISGDTVVIGECQGGTSSSGTVYVWFRTGGTTWTQQGPIVPSDPSASDRFGSSVAIDGDYIAVGARSWDQKTPSSLGDCGAAYVFVRTGTTWAQQARLLASDLASSDLFGNSVTISGATVVIGAPFRDQKTPSTIADCGAAYVFFRTGTTWAQQAQLLADDPSAGDYFGISVSISGDYVAVGAYLWDSKSPSITDCGCVYVFFRSGTTWTQQAQLTGGDPSGSVYLGLSVSINSAYLVAGAYRRATNVGGAYLYKRTGTSWFLSKVLTASDAAASDLFGCSVDVSDRYVAIGAYQWEGTFTDQGAAYTTVLPEVTLGVTPGVITRGNFGTVNTSAIGAPTVTGANGAVTYSWSTGQTTSSLTGISPGTFVLTTTDSAGNYAVTTYVVSNWLQVTVTPGLITHASGVASATGAIALSAVTGGTGTYTTYAWTSGAGATTVATPTTLAAKSTLLPGQYTLTVTDNQGATGAYVYDVSYASPIAAGYIVQASDPATTDYFGWSSAVDGQYMIVGAWNKTQTQTNAGAAYVYRRSDTSATGTYALETKLISQTTGTSFRFGYSVAIGGDTVVVGEYRGGSSATGNAYVWFRTSGTTWTQQGPLVPSDPSADDGFGISVAIDSDTIAVGAYTWDQKTPSSILDCGAAYVFVRSGTTWAQQAQLLASDPSANDYFGWSIAISGTTVVVGAYQWDLKTPSAITDCGAAYVFTRTNTSWSQQAQLLANDSIAGDFFGYSVSVSGDYIAVGASQWDCKSPSITNCGCVYIHFRVNTTWTQQAQLTAGDQAGGDSFGSVVAMNTNYLVTTAYFRTSGRGAAYLFKRTGTSWLLTKLLTASDAAANDSFGYSVDVSDKYIVCGAYGWEGTFADQGAAYTTVLPEIVFTVVPGAITRGNFGSVNTGAIAAPTVTGATGSLTYSWSTGQTTAGISGISPGTFVLTTTDSVGNYALTTYVVANWPQVVVTPGLIIHASGPTSATGAIALSAVTGGTGTYTTYAWTSGIGATTISTPTTLAAKSSLLPGQYTLTTTDSQGATASYVYDVRYVEAIASNYIVQASDPAISDYFGYSSAIDGQYMIVGAQNKTQTQTGAGAAYIYKRSDVSATGTYAFETKLVSQTTGTGFKFGFSVAISGDTVVIGEYAGGTSGSGKVYVWFRSSGTTWTQQGPLVPSDPTSSDQFGYSVAIDGDYIAVGAWRWDQKTPSAITDCGAAYVFLRTGTAWAQQAQLLASDPSASNLFGQSVAISGSTIVVGAYQWDQKTPTAVTDSGAAYVFVRSGTTWSQEAQLLASDPSATDNFGWSVSISGNYVAVGAYNWDSKSPTITDCGCVYIYFRVNTTWTQQAQLTASDQVASDNLGFSVSINGSYLVAGAYGRSSGTGTAYMYRRSGTNWSLSRRITASDAAGGDSFGYLVDVSDRYVAIGAYAWEGAFTDQGAVYTTIVDPLFVSTAGVQNCNFGTANTGSITPTVLGGVGAVTYAWSTGATTLAVTGLAPGNYTLTATDSLGFTATATFTVATYPLLAVTPGVITHATGATTANGAIALSAVTGGTGTYTTYAWTSGIGASPITTPTTLAAKSALLPGQYTLTATDTNSAVAVYVYDVTYVSPIASTYIVTASDPAANDHFGYSSAIDGQYMVVGAHSKTQTQYGAGAAYVYKRTDTSATGTYVFEAKLVSVAIGTNFQLGYSVAISGDTVVVGEPYGGIGTTARGRAYVWFRSSGTTWTQQGPLVPSDPSDSDNFGYSVAIDGAYIAVSTPNWDQKTPSFRTDSGAAYVFFRSGTTWAQQARLLANDPIANDNFGWSIAISGTTVVVGAHAWDQKTPSAIADCGAAYVYVRTNTTWAQQAQLLANDPSASDTFGWSVSISGDYVAVGAVVWGMKSLSYVNCGCVYVFVRNGTTWTQQAQLVAAGEQTQSGGRMGGSVSINSSYLVAGAADFQAAYVYKRTGTSWVLSKKLKPSDGLGGDKFGISVDMSDRYVVVGAYGWDGSFTDQGAVYTTVLPETSLTVVAGAITRGNFGTVNTGAIAAPTVTGANGAVTYSWSTGQTTSSLTGINPGTYVQTTTDSTGNYAITTYVVAANWPQLVLTPGLVTHATGPTSATGAIALSGVAGGTGTYVYAWTWSNGASTITTPTTLGAKSTQPGQYTLTVTDSNSAVAVYVYDVSYVSPIASTYIVNASDPATQDYFGYSSAVDGQYMIVGASGKTQTQTNAGAAYIYKRSDTSATGTYAFETKLVSQTTGTSFYFGNSVAISGDTVVVGEYGGGTTQSGKVHVWFRTTGTTWVQQGPLVPSDPSSGDNFGNGAVAIDGDYIAVGALYWDRKTPSAIADCGAAYVFLRTGTAWAQQAQLLASDPTVGDSFGVSIAISGATVVVGALWGQKTPTVVNNCGAAYVFVRTNTSWAQQAQLLANDPTASDYFGYSVSVSGDYVALGARLWDCKSPSVTDCGCVYVFFRSGATWTQQAQLTAGNQAVANNLGSSVAMNANYLVAGAFARTGNAGAAYLYKRTGTSWFLSKQLTASDAAATDFFGWSVDVSDKYVAIGAQQWEGALTDQGAVYSTVLPEIVLSVTAGAITRGNFGSTGTCAIAAPTVTGATGSVTYSWSTGQTTSSLSSISPGTFTLTTTDSAGNYAVTTYVVANWPQVTVTPGLITHASGPTNATGAIALSAVTGGTGTYTTYAWTSGVGATTVATPTTLAAKSTLLPGQYTLTVTDSNSGVGVYVYDVSYVSPIASTYIVNASDPAASDGFGVHSAVDGQYMIASAYNKTQTQANAGAAYIYKRSDTSATGTYAFETKLVSQTTGTNFFFGASVAISGDTVVVGEVNGGTAASGKAYVWFRTTGTTWTQQGPIVPSDPSANDQFGTRVGIDGEYIAVAARSWDRKTPSAITDCGAAYVFFRTNTTWSQQAQLLASDPSAGDTFGSSIAISGATVVVGAANWDQKTPTAITDCGAAYVFTRTNTTWSQQAQLLASDPSASDSFGSSISVYGDYIAIGALQWDSKSPSITDCGCVYIYSRVNTTWTQQAQLTAGDQVASDILGTSVSINANYVVASARGRTSSAGAAYLFKRTGTTWLLSKLMTASDAAASDWLGVSVDMSDKYIAIGAQAWEGTFTDQGAVYTTVLPANAAITATGGTVTPTNFGLVTGSIGAITVIGGTDTYVSYVWTSSSGASTGLAADAAAHTSLKSGTYTLVATDTQGATGTFVYVVTENTAVAIGGGTVTNVLINGAATGAVGAVTVTGGSGTYASYVWTSSSGASTGLAANASAHTALKAGVYTLMAVDSLGAIATRAFVVSEPPGYTGGAITPPSGSAAADGAIGVVTLTGGTGVYSTISWSNAGAGSTSLAGITSLTAKTSLKTGIYTLSVVDSAGASFSKAFDVFAPIAKSGGAIITAGGGASNGSIAALTITGGSGSYSYAWSNSGAGATTITAQSLSQKSGLAAGTYTLLVTDSSARTASFTFVVGITPTLVLARGAVTHCTVYSGSDGAIGVCAVTGGAGSATVSWASSGATNVSSVVTNFLSKVAAGTYVLTVTDVQGNQAFQSFVIGEPIYATFVSTNQTRTTSGSVTITARGGLGVYAYAWTKNGAAFNGTGAGTASITGLTPGIYECTVTTSLFSAVVTGGVGTFMTLSASATLLNASWEPVTGAAVYTVEYRKTGDAVYSTFLNKSSALSVVIPTLTPLTEYEVRVLADAGSGAGSVVYYSDTITTLSASAGFTKPSLQAGATFDIRSVQTAPGVNLTQVLEAIFDAGDDVTFKATVRGSNISIRGKVAKRDLAFDVDKGLTLFIPFDSTDVAEQTAVLKLSDGSTQTLVYSSENNALVLGSVSYISGDTFFIDGLKVTVGES